MDNKAINKIKVAQDEHLNRLHQIVEEAIREEKSIVENLSNPPSETITRGQSIADKVASFGGSWKFIIIFGVIVTVWVIFNVIALGALKYDPYPFILMNLVLSCIAALQAPVILMSQNRKEEKDRKRAENDYLVNLKAELEIRSLHQKIDLLLEEQIKMLFDTQAQQMGMIKELHKMVDNLSKTIDQGADAKQK